MRLSVLSVAAALGATLSVTAGAQSGGGTMSNDHKMTRTDVATVTYTGCIEPAAAAGTFVLTHVAHGDGMSKDAMSKGMMSKDTMAKDAMSKDTMAKDAMSKDAMAGHDMGKNAMAPTTLTLAGSSVDLRKYSGQKVTVSGSLAHGAMDGSGAATDALTIKSLKTVAKSCS